MNLLRLNLPRSADFSPQEAAPAWGRSCGLKSALRTGSWPRGVFPGPPALSVTSLIWFLAAVAVRVTMPCLEAAGGEFFEPVQPPRRFQVIAHRGEARQAPANTRPALVRCIEDGIEWAEVDVRLTRDGHHVLAHDDRLANQAGGALVIAESSLAELRTLDLGSAFAPAFASERLLSLGEALALARESLNLYLDCKAVDPELLAREIQAPRMERQVVVFGSPTLLSKLHAASEGRLALMAKWPGKGDVGAWAASNHLAAVEVDADLVTDELCRTLHERGVKVQAKVLGESDQSVVWERVMGAGVDWLQTDLPEEVLAHAFRRAVTNRPVRFSLHRGASRYAPENTLPAFEKALRLGADLVEFDVRATSDGKYFLLHDGRLDRTTDGSGPIRDAPSNVVARLSAGDYFSPEFRDTRLPTLDQFLDALAGRVDLYVDAKEIAPAALAEALERHGVVERAVVYQAPAYLQQLKSIKPSIRVLPPLKAAAELDELVAVLKPYGVDVAWEILSRELIERCHALGVRVFADALGRHEAVEAYLQAIDWGIDVIQTDHPLRLLRAMELALLRKGAVPIPAAAR